DRTNSPIAASSSPVMIDPDPVNAIHVSPAPNPTQMPEPRSAGQNHDGRRRRPAWTMDDSRSLVSSPLMSSRNGSRIGGLQVAHPVDGGGPGGGIGGCPGGCSGGGPVGGSGGVPGGGPVGYPGGCPGCGPSGSRSGGYGGASGGGPSGGRRVSRGT